jgi:hypothetical protein
MMREEQEQFEAMVKQLGLADWMMKEMDIDDDEDSEQEEDE